MTRNIGVRQLLIGAVCVLLALLYVIPCIGESAELQSATMKESPIVSVLPRSQTVQKGETFTVDIHVDPKDCGVSGGELDLSFDPGIATVKDIVPGGLLGEDTLEGVRVIDNDAGEILYALGRQGETQSPTAPKVFATITFVADDTVDGSFLLDIKESSFCDEQFEDIPQVITNNARVCVAGDEVIRDLPTQVVRGTSFDVAITFSAPQDGFNAIGLSDMTTADCFSMRVRPDSCEPKADYGKATENHTEYIWLGPYDADTSFTALYQVNVADDASLGLYSFDGWLEYYIGADGPYTAGIGGDLQVVVKATAEPQLGVIPPKLDHDFGSVAFGQKESWDFDIKNNGLGVLEWSIEDDQPWIEVNPAKGETTIETDTITLTIDTIGLAGVNAGTITVTSNGGTEKASIGVQVESDTILEPAEIPGEFAMNIVPNMPLTTDDLFCRVTEGKGQAETGYMLQWYKNGIVQSDMVKTVVLANNTNTGDVWKCVALPSNGSADDAYAEDEVIVFAFVSVLDEEIPTRMNAIVEADTEVYFTGTGIVTGSVGITKYRQKPVVPNVALPIAPGKEPLKFIDVQVGGFSKGTADVTVHYTDDEISGFVEESLDLFYWEGEDWLPVPNVRINADENNVSGELAVSLFSGLPLAVGGEPLADVGEEDTSDANWMLIVAVVAGALVVIYLVARATRRNRGKNQVTE